MCGICVLGGLPHISPHARASLSSSVDHTYALVDCENVYVSCERGFEPGLRERPVAVLSNNDGCIIVRSEELKAPGPDGEEGVPMGAPSVKGTSFRLPFPTPRLVMPTVRNTSPLLNLAIIGERELVRTSARAGAQPARRRGEFRRRREGPQERGFSPAGGRRTSRYGDAPVHRSDRAGEPF